MRHLRPALLTLIQAVSVPIILEGLWAAYCWGQGWPTYFRWLVIGCEFLITLLVIIGLRVWAAVWLASFIHAANAIRWSDLGSWVAKQKVVSWGSGIILVPLYIVHFLKKAVSHCDASNINWASHIACQFDRDVMAFDFLGHHYEATDILTIELLGLLIGFVALYLYRAWAPPPLKQPPKLGLADALREWPHGIKGYQLANTLSQQVDEQAAKPEWSNHDWSSAREAVSQLDEVSMLDNDPGAALQAGRVIELFPKIPGFQERMTRLFFDALHPARRWVLAGMLAVSEVLTAFPILIRIITTFFERLGGTPQ